MRSDELFEQAKAVLPGGVCASTRLNVGLGKPMYVRDANGARFTDVDGREYLDMCCSHGAVLLGHAYPPVLAATGKAAGLGICCSFDTEHHVALAETICRMVPCAERVRFTNSGTEATLHALRLCRAFTGRDKIIRFLGHFHGYHEYTYIGGHPPKSALDSPSRFVESAGIPSDMSQYIIAVPFDDLEAAEQAIRTHRHEAGTVILEPVNYNNGCLLPRPGFLEGLRRLTVEHNMLLFFDEIQSAFKKSPGGAQQDFGVTPDICDVQHSGTFNAPLISILAGLAFCREILKPEFYPHLLAKCERFHQALDEAIERVGAPVVAPHHGARFGLLMGLESPPVTYRDTLEHRKDIMLAFVRETAERGVYFHDYGGQACHHGFSAAHTDEDLDHVLEVVEEALAAIKGLFASSPLESTQGASREAANKDQEGRA